MNPCSLHAKPKALWGCQRSSLTSQRQVSGYQASSSGRSPVSTQASSAAVVAPGQLLGPKRNRPISITEGDSSSQQFGVELTADQWQPWDFDPLNLSPQHFAADSGIRARPTSQPGADQKFDFGAFLKGDLPKKLLIMLALVALSRLGVYIRVPGVDVAKFEQSMQGGGLLGYIDALSGGSISKVGVFSLGIVPYINASIILQLLATSFPSLKKLQREEGPQGRARFQLYQKLAALVFALAQSVGAMVLVHIADTITELKLGNGTSVLIFANIASALPTSVGAALSQAASKDSANVAIYAGAFFLTTLGIVYVQEAERKIPMNYASRYRNSALSRQSYLPFKVNATGVMPVIFSSSLLALPTALARYANSRPVEAFAAALNPSGPFYLPTNIALIVAFNYYYTFLQLDPKDLADQLKRQGASIPAVRPGRATAAYISGTLERMSILGSAFLGALAAAPPLVELFTKLQAFRGFAGTSVLILVGVATDTARKVRAEQAMQKYKDVDRLYDDLK
ncbi:hypothetical protein WJX82_009617 [Trebouxia sp. C0006]